MLYLCWNLRQQSTQLSRPDIAKHFQDDIVQQENAPIQLVKNKSMNTSIAVENNSMYHCILGHHISSQSVAVLDGYTFWFHSFLTAISLKF